jgi:hypothetical protein
MKTQRTPDKTRAEYCLIPLTHKARPYTPQAATDVRKTWMMQPNKRGNAAPWRKTSSPRTPTSGR